MGGSITVVCRKSNGEVCSLLRWTNPLPFFIHHHRFLSKDEDYLQEYIDQPTPWHDEPDFHQSILPSEYGIVFIDWQNNKIIAANGYTSFGHNYSTEWEFPGNFLPSPQEDNKLLYEQGKVKAAVEMWVQNQEPKGFLTEGLSYEEFIEKLKGFTSQGKRRRLCSIVLDMSPFEVVNLMDDQEGFAKFRTLVEAEGVQVDKSWDKEMEERFADY